MEKNDLIDQLVARAEQLKETMQVIADNFNLDAFLIQSIADHADEAFLTAMIEDIEKFLLLQEDESIEQD